MMMFIEVPLTPVIVVRGDATAPATPSKVRVLFCMSARDVQKVYVERGEEEEGTKLLYERKRHEYSGGARRSLFS